MTAPTLVECGFRCDCAAVGRACPFFGRHPLRPDPALTATVRGALNLDENNVRKDLTPAERSAATTEPKMPDVPAPDTKPSLPEIVAKTPVLQDKRLWFAVATVVCLILSSLLKIDINPETLTGIIVTVVGYIAASAHKEATVAKAIASNQG